MKTVNYPSIDGKVSRMSDSVPVNPRLELPSETEIV